MRILRILRQSWAKCQKDARVRIDVPLVEMAWRGRPHLVVLINHLVHARALVPTALLDRLSHRGFRLSVIAPPALATAIRHALTADWPACPASVRHLAECERVPWHVRWQLRQAQAASIVHRARLGWATYVHKRAQRRTAPAILAARWLEWWTGDAEAWWRRHLDRSSPSRRVLDAMRDLAPTVVLYPTLVADSAARTVMLRAARHMGARLVALQASWDCLTSKGAFPVVPDALLVWGDAGRAEAAAHHRLEPPRVRVVGAPHLTTYGAGRAREANPRLPVVLIAGTSVTYWRDEQRCVAQIVAARAAGEIPPCEIVYRTHPRGATRPGVAGATLQRGAYRLRHSDWQADRAAVESAAIVVSAFSSMLMEAAGAGVPIAVVAFGRTVAHMHYEHSQQFLAAAGSAVCRSPSALIAAIRHALETRVAAPYWAAWRIAERRPIVEIAQAIVDEIRGADQSRHEATPTEEFAKWPRP